MAFSLSRWVLCAWIALAAAPTLADSDQAAIEAALGRGALQVRLQNAGCYAGDVDGHASPALDAAIARCPTQSPQLRIETGMHIARIGHISADAACRTAATASNDKTVRVWSLPDGKLLRTLRVPIDSGNDGAVYATAMSPDGRWIAAGGFDVRSRTGRGNGIYIFDATSGEMVKRLDVFTEAILNLVYSPDGQWLAATSGRGVGIKIFNTTTWDYIADKRYAGDVYGATFAPDGRFYASSLDGKVYGYGPGPDFRRISVARTRSGRKPISIAVDPTQGLVAVGFGDTTNIDVFDSTLAYQFRGDGSGMLGNLGSVAWARTGAVLAAGGRFAMQSQGAWTFPLVAFDRSGRRLGAAVSEATNTISDVHPCNDDFLVSTADPAFGLVGPNGRNSLWQRGIAADLRNSTGDAFTISDDGRRVRFGVAHGGSPVLFDLSDMTLIDAPAPVAGFRPAIVDGLQAHKVIRIEPDDEIHTLAVRPDLSGYLLGTENYLYAATPDGQVLWKKPGSAAIWGTDLTADGTLAVAAYGDGTIRWHRWSDGAEVLTLFVNRVTKTWVAWTPSGYYAASPGGEDLIGWQVNRGWDQTPDFFPASRFRDRFNRPDIVRLVLATLDESAAVQEANAKANRSPPPEPLIADLPPVIRITDPVDGGHVAKPDVTINYAWRSPTGKPVDRIVVLVNGQAVKDIGLPVHAAGKDSETPGTTQLTLRDHANEVGLVAWSGDRASQEATVRLTWDDAPAATSTNRKLYALVIGVSDYVDPDLALHFAAKDAHDFGATLAAQKTLYYRDVDTRVITDRAVTRASLIEGMKWLASKVVAPDDVGVLFLAGHGMTDAKQTYWFLPSDATADNYDVNGVSQDELRRLLQGLPGKVLWFLDTCHAGGAAKRPPVDMNVLVNTVTSAENGGIVVFASSKGRQVSLERPEWGNGAFTKALVEGIEQGKAQLSGRSLVTTSSLDSFVSYRVGDLTNGAQSPVMERPPEEPDFTIARTGADLSPSPDKAP